MSKLLKRWLAYLLIPAGLVLLLFPLNTHRMEMGNRDFVFLEIDETLHGEITTESALPDESTSGDEAMQELAKQLEKMGKLFSEDRTTTNSYGYPVLDLEDLAPYPALQREVGGMMRMIALHDYERTTPQRLKGVQIDEWSTFQRDVLADTGNFQYGNRIFKGHVQSEYVSVAVEIANLKPALKIAGGLFLVLSLFALYGMYTLPSGGIQIGRRVWMVVWDAVTLAIGIFFTSAFLDAMLVKYFQVAPFWGDEKMALFMGVFWVVFGNLVMALYTTSTALQVVWVTGEGVTLQGLLGRKFIAWPDVESIQLTELFSVRRINGFFAPRKVAKVLKIKGGFSRLLILEPPLSSTKKEVLQELAACAPKRLQQAIADLSGKWLSVW